MPRKPRPGSTPMPTVAVEADTRELLLSRAKEAGTTVPKLLKRILDHNATGVVPEQPSSPDHIRVQLEIPKNLTVLELKDWLNLRFNYLIREVSKKLN